MKEWLSLSALGTGCHGTSHELLVLITSTVIARREKTLPANFSSFSNRPCDRMMLGSAVALSHEHDLPHNVSGSKQTHESENQEEVTQTSLQLRTHRSIRLLFIYINQLASRVGCSISKIPFHSELRDVIYCTVESVEAGWHDIATAWIDLTRLGRSASDMLFPTGAAKNDLLHKGRYLELLSHFQNLLQQWKNKYSAISGR
jgi:hypothetical protein